MKKISAILLSALFFCSPSFAKEGTDSLTKKVCLSIPKMHCQGCVDRISEEIENVDGVVSTNVDLSKKGATVQLKESSKNLPKILEAVKDAGYEAKSIKCS